MVTSLRTFLTEEKVLEAAGAGYFARICSTPPQPHIAGVELGEGVWYGMVGYGRVGYGRVGYGRIW